MVPGYPGQPAEPVTDGPPDLTHIPLATALVQGCGNVEITGQDKPSMNATQSPVKNPSAKTELPSV